MRHIPVPRQRQEDALQRAAVQYLRLVAGKRFIVIHVPNGGQRSPLEAAILVGLGVVAGAPDVLVMGNRFCGCLELKSPNGRLSPAQRRFKKDCEERAIPWALARDLRDVERIAEDWGLLGWRTMPHPHQEEERT